jgi:glucose dehydrogenase
MMITALVLTIIGMFLSALGGWVRYVFTGLGAVLLVLMVVRMTSRDTGRRYQENLKYLTLVTGVKDWFRRTFRARSAGAQTTAKRARRAKKNPTWNEMRQYKVFHLVRSARRGSACRAARGEFA